MAAMSNTISILTKKSIRQLISHMALILVSTMMGVFMLSWFSHAAETVNQSPTTSWSEFGQAPTTILDSVVQRANDTDAVQENALNDVDKLQGSYQSQYRLTNTFDSLRQNISPYLEWAYYIGLSIAVILLIINGAKMVAWSGLEDVKKNLMNIVVWVLILTSTYFILYLLLSILALIF